MSDNWSRAMRKIINNYEFIFSDSDQIKNWYTRVDYDNYIVGVYIPDEYFGTTDFLSEVNLLNLEFINQLIQISTKVVEPIACFFSKNETIKVRINHIGITMMPEQKFDLNFMLYFGEDNDDVDLSGVWKTHFINRDQLVKAFRIEY